MRWMLARSGYTLTSWCTPRPQLKAHPCTAACNAIHCPSNSHTAFLGFCDGLHLSGTLVVETQAYPQQELTFCCRTVTL